MEKRNLSALVLQNQIKTKIEELRLGYFKQLLQMNKFLLSLILMFLWKFSSAESTRILEMLLKN